MTELTESRSDTKRHDRWWSLAWWVLALGATVGTMASLYVWRVAKYHMDNPSVMKGYQGPPFPFETLGASWWLFAAGLAAGSLVLALGYGVMAGRCWEMDGSTRAVVAMTLAFIGLLVVGIAALRFAIGQYQ